MVMVKNRLKYATAVSIVFLLSIIFVPLASADWPMFRYDLNHTGVGSGDPVLNPVLIWNFTTDFFVDGSPAVANGIVYIGSDDQYLFAINSSNGNLVWKYKTGTTESSPAVADDIVYIGTFDSNTVAAFNATNGLSIWNFTTQPWNEGTKSLRGSKRSSLLWCNGRTNVYALNSANGQKIWNFTTNAEVDSSPAIAGGIVYIGSNDNNVYALNATTGNELWSYKTGDRIFSCSPSVVEGVVYIGSFDGKVYALNATSGAKVWSYTVGDFVVDSPAVDNDVVYIGA